MSERPLLLSSARSAVLVEAPARPPFVRTVAVAVGLITIAVGALDLGTRLAPFIGGEVGVLAFAPAIVELEPAALGAARGASTTEPFVPTRLSIPSLAIDASVEQVGVKENGSMANPSSFATTGWYKYGAKAGEPGNAVIAGHVNNGVGLAGVFSSLGSIAIGERVALFGAGGKTLTYVVKSKTRYDTASAPLASIFSISGPSQLVLITCEGDWDPETRSYDSRLVVVAQLEG